MANWADWHERYETTVGVIWKAKYTRGEVSAPVIEYYYTPSQVVISTLPDDNWELGVEITIVNLTTSDITITNTLYYDSTDPSPIKINNWLDLQPFDCVTLRCVEVTDPDTQTDVKRWLVRSHQKNNNI